jgi:integrase
VTKYLKNFKKIILIALEKEWLKRDPFAGWKFTLDDVERDFLESHEIEKVWNKPIEIERLAQVRDVFIFCALSGLSFSDVKQLRPEHIATDIHGNKWIRKARQKTKNMCNIPLMEIPLQIIKRYRDHPYCVAHDVLLPVLSNQKYNSYLKELADICGIKKAISSHSARHTFGTYALANGVSMESVAKMLGHSDTKMTRHYARVLDSTVLKEMSGIGGNLVISNPQTSSAL